MRRGRTPKLLIAGVATVAGAVAVLLGLVLSSIDGFDDPKTYSTFEVCGRRVEVFEGYIAYGYGSLPHEEAPDDTRTFDVQSSTIDEPPPVDYESIFRELPIEVSRLLDDSYESWRADIPNKKDGPTLGGLGRTNLDRIDYPGGCSVAVALDIDGVARSGWAIHLHVVGDR